MLQNHLLPKIGLLILLVIAGCTPGDETFYKTPLAQGKSIETKVTLVVFAASSLTEAFTAIKQAFEVRHPGTEVILNLAGSQQLAQQLVLGAPADVFASANRQQMQAVIEAGRIDSIVPLPFAHNRLVVVTPANNPAGLNRLQDLARPNVRLVLAAEDVPVGRYSRQFLEKASRDPSFSSIYEQDVLAQVVSFELNVRVVLRKVMLGEADAGIVYASDLVGADVDKVRSIDIPDPLNTVSVYPIAPISNGIHADLARDFVSFVLSPEGQEIITQFGFLPVYPS